MSLLATVQDTLGGAVELSIVDFFLSIVIIVGLSFALYLLPLLNKVGIREKKTPKTETR